MLLSASFVHPAQIGFEHFRIGLDFLWQALGQVFAEPQIVHRGMRIDLPHPTAGKVPGVRNPINYSRTPLEYRMAPPLLGEHTDAVLEAELGLDSAERARLRAVGAIR